MTQPWQQLICRAKVVASSAQIGLTLVDRKGKSTKIVLPNTIRMQAFAELRKLMYQPGKGTWYSMTLTITQPGNLDVDFNNQSEPDWEGTLSPQNYMTDQNAYPRDVASQPEWLKAKLALAAAEVAQTAEQQSSATGGAS